MRKRRKQGAGDRCDVHKISGYRTYDLTGGTINLYSTDETLYDDNENPILTTQTVYGYDYPKHYQPSSKTTINSNKASSIIDYRYPPSLNSPSPAEQVLINQNRIAEPLETKITVTTPNDSTVLSESTQKTIYKDWGNNLVLPEKIQILKGDNFGDLEDRIIYHDYDTNGNPLEVSQANGTNITYLWGYNQQYPIAKIENATLSEVASAIGLSITAIKTNGITDLSVIDHIRENLPNAQVTTYTYNPLIGVTSITDPRGYSMYYQYNNFNRLEFVKDAEGNILSKNDYHYKE
jgi:YD repeat-containing protein